MPNPEEMARLGEEIARAAAIEPPRRIDIRDVEGCARCGGSHKLMTFFEFIRPPEVGGRKKDRPIYQFWGMCPISGDPLLLRWERI